MYSQHLESQHLTKWNEYRSLSADAERSFFDATVLMNTMHAHFVVSGDQLYFHINAIIFDVILRTLLFDPEAENVCIDQVLRFFEPIKSDSVLVGYQKHQAFQACYRDGCSWLVVEINITSSGVCM